MPPRLQSICERLASNDPSLTDLRLAGYDTGERMGDKGAMALADALKSNTMAKALVLCSNEIGPLGVRAIFESLVHGTSIESLNLRDNHVGSNEGASGALSLVGKTRLKKLILTNNNINADNAAALATGLERNETLQVLYLSGNPIGDVGAVAFGKTLQSPAVAIRTLYLSTCAIENTGVKGLADGLESNSTIDELVLLGNCIGTEGAKYLAKKLKVNRGLKELYLQQRLPLGNSALEALIREGLQHNYSLQNIYLDRIMDPHLQEERLFYLKLNRAGRRLLQGENVPPSLWVHVLEKVSRDPDSVYYFLRGNPQLLKGRYQTVR